MNISNISERLKGATAVLDKYGAPENLFSRLVSAYFMISAGQIILARGKGLNPVSKWQDFIMSYPLAVKLLGVIVIFLGISILYRDVFKKHSAIDHGILIISALVFSLCVVWRSANFYLGAASGIVAAVFAAYGVGRIRQEAFERLPDLPSGILVLAAAAIVIAFVAVTTIARHLIFGSFCFDLGIFVQMFHSLKAHFTAVTTCERNILMSHFQVHASFIFYLFLPIYILFPKAETLLAGQAFFAIAGVVPLFLMARKRDFKGFGLVAMCLVYVFCAGVIMPCYYDFHENAFLPTILMWFLYAVDRRKIPLFYIMSVLTCIVKEDAPMYVMCIAMFFAIEETGAKRRHGIIVTALAAIYFIIILGWLNRHGDGEFMTTSRFGNLVFDGSSGFVGVICNSLTNPSYLISLFLQERTLLFFVQVMLPLLFLPFFTLKIHRFLLMVPFLIMNLVVGAGYGYAAELGFQYIFGPACLLIYMAMRNVEEMPRERRNALLIAMTVLTMTITVSMVSNRWGSVENYQAKKDYYQSAEECLNLIPKDASVLTPTGFLPHIADRDEVYEFDGRDFIKDDSENVLGIIDLDKYDFCAFSKKDSNTEPAVPILEEAGWTVYAETEELVIIYVNPEY